MDVGSTGNGAQFRIAQFLQSLEQPAVDEHAVPSISSRCLDPVTVPAAPRNVSEAMG